MNNGLKCRKPVFIRVSGICFIKWLWFGSICGWNNELEENTIMSLGLKRGIVQLESHNKRWDDIAIQTIKNLNLY